MTLQKLLLKLSRNKTIRVECLCSDEEIKILLSKVIDQLIELKGKFENDKIN